MVLCGSAVRGGEDPKSPGASRCGLDLLQGGGPRVRPQTQARVLEHKTETHSQVRGKVSAPGTENAPK